MQAYQDVNRVHAGGHELDENLAGPGGWNGEGGLQLQHLWPAMAGLHQCLASRHGGSDAAGSGCRVSSADGDGGQMGMNFCAPVG